MASARIQRVVVERALTSVWLPEGPLLPIGGVPSIVLCVRRVSNRGLPVCVAISKDAIDDPVAQLLTREGIRFVRGPSADLRARLALACDDLPDEAVFARVDAACVFVDGELLTTFEIELRDSGARHLAARPPEDGYPTGLSAELCEVGAFRRSRSLEPARPPARAVDQSHLRCRIDTLDDYCRLAALFADEPDGSGVHHDTLLARLASLPDAPRSRIPFRLQAGVVHGSMALGSAQLGLAYGATNTVGLPAVEDVRAIVRTAVDYGVTCLDTARAYGLAESRLGELFAEGLAARASVVTKLDPLSDVPGLASAADLRRAVDASVFRSCRELHLQRLPTLLLHRAAHRDLAAGAIWQRLEELKAEGVIERLGTSVYTVDEALAALDDPAVEHLQIPFNILDGRWERASFSERASARPDVVIHGRGALLQGILAAPPERWPRCAGAAEPLVRALDSLVTRFGRRDRGDLCFAYARSQPFMTSVVVGVERMTQLERNLSDFCSAPLSPAQCEEARGSLPEVGEVLLDPSRW